MEKQKNTIQQNKRRYNAAYRLRKKKLQTQHSK